MERSPGNSAEEHHGNSDKSSKKRGERTLLRLPLIAQEQQAEQKADRPAENRKPTAIEAALANLAAQKREDEPKKAEAAKQPTEASDEQSPVAPTEADNESVESEQTPDEAVESQTQNVETVTEESEQTERHEAATELASETEAQPEVAEEDYPKWEYQELTSIDLGGGGETVVHLQGDTPIAERVIPLESSVETDRPASAQEATPVFTPQPEQQHQAQQPEQLPFTEVRDAATNAEPFPVSNVSIGERPRQAMVPTAEIIEPQLADIYEQQTVAPAAAVAPAYGEQVATKRDVEDLAYRAERAGQNRGAFTGLLVGAGYEHFKHKRRERRQVKRMQEQGKQLEAARQNYQVGLQEQAKRQAESTAVFESMELRVNGLEKEKRQQRPEAAKTPERTVAERPVEQLQIPPEHRLETSAWHSIEVDARTGKPVENQSFEYGQEYHYERAQEQAQAAQQQMSEAATNAAGPSSIASGSSAPTDDHASLPPVYIPSATTQGAPKNSASRDDSKRSSNDDGAQPAPPLWPWLVALFAVVICLIFVLR